MPHGLPHNAVLFLLNIPISPCAQCTLFPHISILPTITLLPPSQSSHCTSNSQGRMELLIPKTNNSSVYLYHTSVLCNKDTSLSPYCLLFSKGNWELYKVMELLCVSSMVDSNFTAVCGTVSGMTSEPCVFLSS